MAIKTIGEQITNDRAIDLCIAAIEWAIEHSEQMTHDLRVEFYSNTLTSVGVFFMQKIIRF